MATKPKDTVPQESTAPPVDTTAAPPPTAAVAPPAKGHDPAESGPNHDPAMAALASARKQLRVPSIGRIVRTRLYGGLIPAIITDVHNEKSIGVVAFTTRISAGCVPLDELKYQDVGDPKEGEWAWPTIN